MKNNLTIIDLSQTIEHNDNRELEPAKIKRIQHKKGAFILGLAYCVSKSTFHTFINFFKCIFTGKILSPKDFPNNLGLAWEEIKLSTHTGTHLDAPYHFGPKTNNKEAKTIEQVPLNYCYNDGVLLDFSYKATGEIITKEDIQNALNKIKYVLKENDIVLIKTCARNNPGKYLENYPGVSPEAIIWLIEKGIKIVGTDAWSMDRPVKMMIREYLESKDKSKLWPAHFIGRLNEYWHIEKLENLDKLPAPYGFKVACFPIKIKGASAGWTRVVAIIEK